MINSLFAVRITWIRMPRDIQAEATEGRVGFIHPYTGTIEVEASTLKVLLRSFDRACLESQEKVLRDMVAQTQAKYPDVKISIKVQENYKNMKEVLKYYPELTDNAIEATKRAGLKPIINAIRGGTDGSHLTFEGLPTPDLFTGGQNFHGKLEFNSRRGLEKTTETLVNLVQVYAEKAK
jgi:tripeptide aminopeptidase